MKLIIIRSISGWKEKRLIGLQIFLILKSLLIINCEFANCTRARVYGGLQCGDTSNTKADYQQVSKDFARTNGRTNAHTKWRTNLSQNVSRQSRKFRGLSQKFRGLTEKSHGLS